MSTASRDHARRRHQAGFTLLEMIITMVLLTMMALVIERTLASTQEAHRYLDTTRRVKERGETVAYEVYEAISSSRRVFGRDDVGNGYLGALDLPAVPPLPGARLPLPDETRDMGPDVVGDPRTGNVLLFVRESDPVSCLANPLTGAVRYVDVHRFACIYPHETARKVVSVDTENAIDLVLWYSVGFPSLPQLLAIEDADERRSVVQFLSANGFAHAWDPDRPVGDAFFGIDGLGQINLMPTVGMEIPEEPELSQRGRVVYANTQLARTDPSSYARRCVFTVDPPEDWVPNGFEVKVTGSSGHRKVWLHLVVEGEATRGQEAVHATTLIASVRDF